MCIFYTGEGASASTLCQQPLTMSAALLAFIAILLCILARILNIASIPEKPSVYGSDSKFLEAILKACPSMTDVYNPPTLWGRSGHLQTIIHGIFGRIHCPVLKNVRTFIKLDDGATLTFDIYEPTAAHPNNNDYTIAICPGIANSSESLYIKTFVENAQNNGYRCVVLNHLGALPDVMLTTPRIFTYGGTNEFHRMIIFLLETYVNTLIILVGFSMGGNIITKYLGESRCLPRSLLCGISICQGYDAVKAQPLLLQWDHLRRFYLWVMTETMKGLLRYHSILLREDVKRKFQLDEKKIFASQTLMEFDELYTRRVAGYSSLLEFYKSNSSSNYMDRINRPILFLNAMDDPIVPEELWELPKKFVDTHNKAMFVLLKHGGHLGFFDGGFLYPKRSNWLDRVAIEFANALAMQVPMH